MVCVCVCMRARKCACVCVGTCEEVGGCAHVRGRVRSAYEEVCVCVCVLEASVQVHS